MVTAPEDPIEAIKRRNEERAQKLKEKIASGEFFGFSEAIDEIAEAPPEQTQETTSEFDLSSFPPPPDTGTIPVGGEEAVTAPSDSGLDIEITPLPTEQTPVVAESETAPADLEIEVTPHVEQPPVTEAVVTEPEPVETEAPPPPPEEMVAATAPVGSDIVADEEPVVDVTGITFDGDDYGDFPVPDSWEGEAAPVAESEMAATAPEPEPAVIAEPEPVSEPVTAVTEPEPEPVVEPEPIVIEPEPVVAEPEPDITPVETAPEPVVVKPEPAVVAKIEPEQLTISVDIDVQGNNVRVRRENIDMEGTIELFKKIIEKYEGR